MDFEPPESLNSEVWGKHFWFVIHTMAMSYPKEPTPFTKKKYYEFFQNLPLFLPDEQMGKNWIDLLDQYPITPYLDSRKDLLRWTHFIHNRVNQQLGKPVLDFYQAMSQYQSHYKTNEEKEKDIFYGLRYKQILILSITCLSLFGLGGWMYHVHKNNIYIE